MNLARKTDDTVEAVETARLRRWALPGITLQRGTRHEEFQGAGDDLEFDGETRERFAVDLRVDGILVERLADQRFGFPEMDAFCLTQIAKPQARQAAQVAQAPLPRKSPEL